ncbi:MAG: methyltransferase domain-containing protein [Candidatus Bathyarchaeia archaeon]
MKEKNEMVQVEQVKIIFNQMVEEYDHLMDLWYSYTFGNIDKILLSEFRITSVHGNKPLALDVGCGTGIQSLRLATLGYKVIGIDIADKLLKLAKVKLSKAGYHDAEFGSRAIKGQFGQSLGSWIFDLDNFLIPHGFYGVFDFWV